MTANLQLGYLEFDALREVANIASGHAATALGQLIERRVMITVPTFTAGTVDDIPGLLGYRDQPVAVAVMHVLGDLKGTLAFLMHESKARELSAMLLRRPDEGGGLDALGRSSLAETANILGGAYANALAGLLGRTVMLSVPTFGIEPPERVLEQQRRESPAAQVALCIETQLMVDECGTGYGGHIVLLPDGDGLRLLLDALHLGGGKAKPRP